ncbi:N-acetylmuramoyl-L-alanine amidase [Fontibacillus phaseoli]|uniref:N-acetylmuramoyl-L-alanine amidase n=1 Tax=Fontibacillus phaseoli TaxID=1416533 RepID=A0A369BFT9_9BACL|nr:N-acetylmuramoyl-L-alanine amidase [Fontibacillus phaseoli]RCX20402.1 N-acetylmuramoyl-L-alanine amidase [Fontibacillus phaseoli]
MMALHGYKIFIDPGHGGKDPGATNAGYKESEIVLEIGKFLKTDLDNFGASVQMSRLKDVCPELQDRATASNDFGARIYVSLHINSGGGTGIECWVHDNAGFHTQSLASFVNRSLVQDLNSTNRGIKKAPSQRNRKNIFVIDPKNTKALAILLEILFIDNATDRAKLITNKQVAARAIANGINDFIENLPSSL